MLALALDGGEWSASRPGRALGPTQGTHCIGGWVDLKASLDTEARRKILCLCWGSNLCRSVCSQILYWLIYSSNAAMSINIMCSYGNFKCFTLLNCNLGFREVCFILAGKQTTLILKTKSLEKTFYDRYSVYNIWSIYTVMVVLE
jgi:hypothetical protein